MEKVSLILPGKNEEEDYDKIIDMNNNNDHTTSILLDFCLFQRKLKTNCN